LTLICDLLTAKRYPMSRLLCMDVN